ncbi:hypothetical protein [Paraburkholderia sacchari]|uniref:hypothetical protein n=1 Tax=Paraburkholderia sacchari TaxID=159450 RepID=UPI00054201F5|nr:hypothetical protein [Paraburkholderia sacchari]NLP60280.1 hypothetical protein [Paraburkholderia sacchari]
MNELAEDTLVTVLNIDAEIKVRIHRLIEMERGAEDPMEPWLNEARIILRNDVARLRARREEQLRKLNAVLANRSAGSGNSGGSARTSRHVPFG